MQRQETKTIAAATPELAGKTIAVAETRELDVLAQLFEHRGATVIRCPLMAIRDAPDPTPIEAWLQRFVAGACDDLILFTGEGLRRLLGFAKRIELQDAFVEALGRVRTIARGPKPVRALREIGLAADLQAVEPTTEGIIATLAAVNLTGRAVGVQLYGDEPNIPLMTFLARAGAEVDPVAPYVYACPSGEGRLPYGLRMWLVLAPVQTPVFAPVPETVHMAQVHLLTGPERRRRFSLEQKRAIVAAAFAPGVVVSEVARRADVCASLIYRWRRELGPAPGGFAEVVVAPTIDEGVDSGAVRCLSVPPPVEAARPDSPGISAEPAIEIEFCGSSRVRIPASIPPDLATAVIAALRRR